MKMRLALSTFAVVALVATSGATGRDPARSFLTEAFGVSAADIARIDSGQVVTRTLEVKNRREVATLGIARIRTTPAMYVERLIDIAAFKRTEDIVQIGKFGDQPQAPDVASLTIEDADLKLLRDCRVEACGVRLPEADIERLRREIDWRVPDASRRAGEFVRQRLVDYAIRYRAGGAAAGMEYAATSSRLDVGREFAALVAADTTTWKYVPQLQRHLLDYPSAGDDRMVDFVYWSKERVHRRLVVSLTHVAIAPVVEPSPISVAIASKQIYATHYFDASLGLTLLVADPNAPGQATYVVYLNRSRIDLFDGLFGGMARRIVVGKARTLVGVQLARLQRTLASP